MRIFCTFILLCSFTIVKAQKDTCNCFLLKFYKTTDPIHGGPGANSDFVEKRRISDSMIVYEISKYYKDSFNTYLGNVTPDSIAIEGAEFLKNGFVIFSIDSFKMGRSTSSYRYSKSPFDEYGTVKIYVYKPTGQVSIENWRKYVTYKVEEYNYAKPRITEFNFYDFQYLDPKYLVLEHTYTIRFNPFYGIIKTTFDSGFILDTDSCFLIDGGCGLIRTKMEKKWFGTRK